MKKLAKKLQQHKNFHFDFVDTGFLEIASPSIPAALEQCIENGATEIVIFPYFPISLPLADTLL